MFQFMDSKNYVKLIKDEVLRCYDIAIERRRKMAANG